jgi:hypothetical protein
MFLEKYLGRRKQIRSNGGEKQENKLKEKKNNKRRKYVRSK